MFQAQGSSLFKSSKTSWVIHDFDWNSESEAQKKWEECQKWLKYLKLAIEQIER